MKRINLPYVSFAAFDRAIEHWQRHGLPDTIRWDRLSIFSAALSAQLRQTCRALEFVDQEDRPTQFLHELVTAKKNADTYAKAVAQVLATSYAFANELDLIACSPSDLDHAFTEAGCSEGTRERAMRFYLRLVDVAGLSIGTRLRFGRKREEATEGKNASARLSRRMTASVRITLATLEKLPDFNEDWPTELKLRWIDAVKNARDGLQGVGSNQ